MLLGFLFVVSPDADGAANTDWQRRRFCLETRTALLKEKKLSNFENRMKEENKKARAKEQLKSKKPSSQHDSKEI
eukprot:m.281282 g.281282  ORF g.281282 m.281282 type:complete len:75 (-) comp22888_c0_seq8:24-248(-)